MHVVVVLLKALAGAGSESTPLHLGVEFYVTGRQLRGDCEAIETIMRQL